MTPDAAREYARPYADQFPADHPACVDVDALTWRFDPVFPVARFHGLTNWPAWFAGEVALWAAEGDPARFDDMLDRPIEEPVVVVVVEDVAYPWDGNHRIGASSTTARPTLPAVVGVVDRERASESLFET